MAGAKAGRLAGKVALITGAASGIGRATAALFCTEGARIAASDRNEAGLKTLGSKADLTLAQDVTDEARWRAVVDQVLARFGASTFSSIALASLSSAMLRRPRSPTGVGSMRSTPKVHSLVAARRCG